MTSAELRDHERANILAALAACNGKVFGPGGAAAMLDIKPTTLASRMKALGPRPCPRAAGALTRSRRLPDLEARRDNPRASPASKVLPITENDLYAVAGGVSPISFITLAVSVARKTCSATDL